MCIISAIWDSFVTSPIKHDQLNIFALNVCHGAPTWTGHRSSTAVKRESRRNRAADSEKRVCGDCYFLCSSIHLSLRITANSAWQFLRINICPKLRNVTKQRLMTHNKLEVK